MQQIIIARGISKSKWINDENNALTEILPKIKFKKNLASPEFMIQNFN